MGDVVILVVAFSSASVVISILSVYLLHIVLRKRAEIFWISFAGLISSTLAIFSISLSIYWQIASIPAVIFAEIAHLFVYLLYIRRISSLGRNIRVKFEGGIKVIPFLIVFILSFPLSVYVMFIYGVLNRYFIYVLVVSSICRIVSLAVEIYLFAVLVLKIKLMMELRSNLIKTLLIQSISSFAIIILGEATIIVLNYIIPIAGFYFRYILLKVRILLIVDFYRYIIRDLNRTHDLVSITTVQ
eukprot:NODE_16_length_41655_cov_0.272813.p16 type:complete len:243 gc:universal NODE_16_length_41655_cov_0.272813:4611-3883(-)